MSSAIQNLLEQTLGDVARATKYEASFAFTDPGAPDAKKLIIMGKTASFPGISHTVIDFKYKGRTIPVRGQTKFTQTWECTFHLNEDHSIKIALENWIEALDQVNTYNDSTGNAVVQNNQAKHKESGYTTSISVVQKDFDDLKETAEYTLHNAFPIEVSPVQTNYESRGQLQEITVTFAYSHFSTKHITAAAGNFVDEFIGKANTAFNDKVKKKLENSSQYIDKNSSQYINKIMNNASVKVNNIFSESDQQTTI